ncbi:MAG: type II toxin-antitoxin system prevent-host-death family antitoxin [Actinomycetia bacterium]|nr:type II toxin-antitoxin system prevent-host-death family antitoxin [Actinomycetes bacterium]
MLRNGSTCRTAEVASRDLRNDVAGVLRRVEAGEVITITVKGEPVAGTPLPGPVGGARCWPVTPPTMFDRFNTLQFDRPGRQYSGAVKTVSGHRTKWAVHPGRSTRRSRRGVWRRPRRRPPAMRRRH